MVTLEDIQKDSEINTYLERADSNFAVLGYKEHGPRHAHLAAHVSRNVLKFLGYPARDAELAGIAAYLHDIGHAMAAEDHSHAGAVFALFDLRRLSLADTDIFPVVTAIGSHEDKECDIPSPIAAAVILGDKTDVHRSRVRKKVETSFDVHDRVNYACTRSFLRVTAETKNVSLELDIDTDICSVMDYFQIFRDRTLFAQRAAKYLGCSFSLYINGDKML